MVFFGCVAILCLPHGIRVTQYRLPPTRFHPFCSISPRGCMQLEQQWCTMEATVAHAGRAKLVCHGGRRGDE